MTKIQIDGAEYNVDTLSEHAKKLVVELQKIDLRIQESQNMSAILTKAKKAYIADLKTEMLATKAGFHFGDD